MPSCQIITECFSHPSLSTSQVGQHREEGLALLLGKCIRETRPHPRVINVLLFSDASLPRVGVGGVGVILQAGDDESSFERREQ